MCFKRLVTTLVKCSGWQRTVYWSHCFSSDVDYWSRCSTPHFPQTVRASSARYSPRASRSFLSSLNLLNRITYLPTLAWGRPASAAPEAYPSRGDGVKFERCSILRKRGPTALVRFLNLRKRRPTGFARGFLSLRKHRPTDPQAGVFL